MWLNWFRFVRNRILKTPNLKKIPLMDKNSRRDWDHSIKELLFVAMFVKVHNKPKSCYLYEYIYIYTQVNMYIIIYTLYKRTKYNCIVIEMGNTSLCTLVAQITIVWQVAYSIQPASQSKILYLITYEY